MPVIQVDMMVGRSVEQKREIAKALTEAFIRTAGGKPQSVQIILRDIEKHDWASGGSLVSDRSPDQPASPGSGNS